MNCCHQPIVHLLCCSLLFVVTSATGQLSVVKGTWLNPSMQAIIIDDTASKTNTNYLSTKMGTSAFLLRFYSDTLSFQKHYTSSATGFRKLHIDRYDLKIIQNDPWMLVLKPASKFASDFFGNSDFITVKRQEYTTDSTVHFEKLAFASGPCRGTCPTYEFEIDNTGAFRLHVIKAYHNGSVTSLLDSDALKQHGIVVDQTDSTTTGYFIGQLPDNLHRQLIDGLQTCYLRQLTVEPVLCCDAPLKKLSVYFSGQKKVVETMFPPVILRKLLVVLQKIYDESPRKRTNKPFVVER